MIQSLPESLRDIAAAIGYEKTLAIVEKFAGNRIWIPRNPQPNWIIFSLVGFEAGRKLSELCGGSQIEIPLCRNLKLQQRNEAIRKDRESLTIGALSKKYGLCRWQIHQIFKPKNV